MISYNSLPTYWRSSPGHICWWQRHSDSLFAHQKSQWNLTKISFVCFSWLEVICHTSWPNSTLHDSHKWSILESVNNWYLTGRKNSTERRELAKQNKLPLKMCRREFDRTIFFSLITQSLEVIRVCVHSALALIVARYGSFKNKTKNWNWFQFKENKKEKFCCINLARAFWDFFKGFFWACLIKILLHEILDDAWSVGVQLMIVPSKFT